MMLMKNLSLWTDHRNSICSLMKKMVLLYIKQRKCWKRKMKDSSNNCLKEAEVE